MKIYLVRSTENSQFEFISLERNERANEARAIALKAVATTWFKAFTYNYKTIVTWFVFLYFYMTYAVKMLSRVGHLKHDLK